MKLFITGATGFVALACGARLAVDEGRKCFCLARSTSNLSHLPKSAEVVIGDLRKPESFAVALRGCNAVIHVAADYRAMGA